MPQPSGQQRIILSLDVDALDDARNIIEEVGDHVGMLKFGLELGTAVGWGRAMDFFKQIRPNAEVFADAKFKDIPRTMFGAARSMQRHRPAMFTVHADNNLAALQQALAGVDSGADDFGGPPAKVLAITILTSISESQAQEIYGAPPARRVLENARRAVEAGLEGVVCSPQEVAALREQASTQHLTLVTPGIRPAWAEGNDQARTATPKEAVSMGADYLVIGRPITSPPKGMTRQQAVEKIIEELGE